MWSVRSGRTSSSVVAVSLVSALARSAEPQVLVLVGGGVDDGSVGSSVPAVHPTDGAVEQLEIAPLLLPSEARLYGSSDVAASAVVGAGVAQSDFVAKVVDPCQKQVVVNPIRTRFGHRVQACRAGGLEQPESTGATTCGTKVGGHGRRRLGMRARVITTTGDPDLIEGFATLTAEVLVPASRRQPGYRGYVAFSSPDGVAHAVTLWEDGATEQASDDALRADRENFAAEFGVQLRVERFDVAFAEVLNPSGGET